jgi:hypothetical protein
MEELVSPVVEVTSPPELDLDAARVLLEIIRTGKSRGSGPPAVSTAPAVDVVAS